MKTKSVRALIILCCFSFVAINIYAQVPFPHEATNSTNAERVANFGVSGVDNQVFEITNATDRSNEFLPSLWSHNGQTDYHTIQYLSTTNRSLDRGNTPLVLFISAVAPGFNLNAPSQVQFPWGNGGTLQSLNNRPAFSWRNGTTTAMLLSANNNLGIGTSTPSSRLHVNGSVRFESIQTQTNLSYTLGIDDDGNVFKTAVSSGGQQDSDWLRIDDQQALDIDNSIYTNGNVGINISNPTAALHTSGSLIFDDLITTTTNIEYYLGVDEVGRVYKVPKTLDPDDVAVSNDNDWLKLDNTFSGSINDNIYTLGKVAINLNFLPSRSNEFDLSGYGLFVGGGVLTEEVRVSLQNEWADYVFKDDYKLMSIEELERHIDEKGHLPNVPNAEVVESEGLELGDMNRILLEKIEELSLYIIQLNKKIKSQEEKINSLVSKSK